jgi:hypothetical protein
MARPRQDSWFFNLFGFKETVDLVKTNFEIEQRGDHEFLISRANHVAFNAGRFSVRNLSSFNYLLADSAPETPGTFHVIVGSDDRSLVDVLSAQSLPAFDGATFQAASNFNCLEFVHDFQTPYDGVTSYVHDQTQGPYCALAAGAALVYRNYFIPNDDGTRGQLERQVELLGGTAIAGFVNNGYPILPKQVLERPEVKDANWDDLDQFRIGVHEHGQVTTSTLSGRSVTTDPDVVPQGRVVHHVYAAAFNFRGMVALTPVSERISRQMLKAEYQATVLAAWEMSKKYPGRTGSQRLVLTALGGGVFDNPRTWIVEAILSCEDLIRRSGLQVYFVCFSQSALNEFQEAGILDLMGRLNGKIVRKVEDLD